MPRLIAAVLALVLLAQPAAAEKRLALVIGNDAYAEVTPLRKAVNDARAMAAALAAMGFEVITAENAGRREMNFKVQSFVNRIGAGDVAAVFYAGHGVEIAGENFLLPVDIPRGSEALIMLQRSRDEAHRFAVTYHRASRTRRDLRSEVDEIGGVGPRRRKALLTAFGSIAGIRRATREDLARVVGRKCADTVLAHFSAQP